MIPFHIMGIFGRILFHFIKCIEYQWNKINGKWKNKPVCSNKDLEDLKRKRPPSTRYWMISHNWTSSHDGSCSDEELVGGPQHCKFIHPWIPDHADLTDETGLGLEGVFKNRLRTAQLGLLIAILVSPPVLILILTCICVKKTFQG